MTVPACRSWTELDEWKARDVMTDLHVIQHGGKIMQKGAAALSFFRGCDD
jgi:hypothetical protein